MRTDAIMSPRGSVLVICLMILVILSLMGAAAIMSGSMEISIAYNARKADQTFYAADAGIDASIGMISYFANERPDPAAFPDNLRADLQGVVRDQFLLNEVVGDTGSPNDGVTDNPEGAPDAVLSIGNTTAAMDIDRLGGAKQPPGGSTKIAIYFRVHSEGQEAGSRAGVEMLYRLVVDKPRDF